MTSTFPSIPGPGLAAVSLLTLGVAAYLVTLHLLIVLHAWPMASLLLVAAPWLIAALTALLKPGRDVATKPVRVASAALLVAASAVIAWVFGRRLAARVELMLYVENLAFMLALTAAFAITLRPGGTALITRLATVARGGDMPPSVVRYTRAVTLAWSAFFAAMAAASTVLFVLASRDAWSAFVNLAVWPLVVAMFVLEYAVRRRVLPDVDHVSMMTGMRAFNARDGRADRARMR